MNPQLPGPSPVALIADDDIIIRMFAREALEQAGWTVEEADNGREGLDAFQRLQPDVVLLDVMMPEMDGFAACAALRQLPAGRHTPILIMTGLDDFDSITKAYEAGATDFIIKPLNALLLTHRVRYMVRANQVLQALLSSQAKLAQARDAALEGARLKSEFLATMSHEIRTPMNGVLGMTDWLLETDLTTEQKECAETIRSSGEALMVILNDILDLSKIDSGKLTLELMDFELPAFVNRVLALFRERAQRKGLELTSRIAEGSPMTLHGDPTRLQQVLSNLVNNAIKFSEHGTITILVEPAEPTPEQRFELSVETSEAASPTHLTHVQFSVEDQGIGISSGAMAKLFQPFVQADGSTTRKYGGTGLGLAICKQLVELMGGHIGAASKPGTGSVFRFTVPLQPSPPTTTADKQAA
ncbi:MAG: putative hybrid histidine kinase [Nitrospira sp. OLB3]|nr:MAG: putative hybrid histidine kinase [Nitrospira sp. OLB3]MCK6499385.1 ATP-binding protein [Nitrospira sp.]MEB2339042.1 ATP-binding protein [Nitrospirales bacterium]RIK59756.1 MAG: hybrid sensor histidine kinase/response regulator [Nitrospira sp.]